jgi:hypothetical protein
MVKTHYWHTLYKTVKERRAETDVVVPVVRVVVVADRDTRILFIVVPRAAAQTL